MQPVESHRPMPAGAVPSGQVCTALLRPRSGAPPRTHPPSCFSSLAQIGARAAARVLNERHLRRQIAIEHTQYLKQTIQTKAVERKVDTARARAQEKQAVTHAPMPWEPPAAQAYRQPVPWALDEEKSSVRSSQRRHGSISSNASGTSNRLLVGEGEFEVTRTYNSNHSHRHMTIAMGERTWRSTTSVFLACAQDGDLEWDAAQGGWVRRDIGQVGPAVWSRILSRHSVTFCQRSSMSATLSGALASGRCRAAARWCATARADRRWSTGGTTACHQSR